MRIFFSLGLRFSAIRGFLKQAGECFLLFSVGLQWVLKISNFSYGIVSLIILLFHLGACRGTFPLVSSVGSLVITHSSLLVPFAQPGPLSDRITLSVASYWTKNVYQLPCYAMKVTEIKCLSGLALKYAALAEVSRVPEQHLVIAVVTQVEDCLMVLSTLHC